jgi:RNA polymerase sigma factor (TIGR02999 family)
MADESAKPASDTATTIAVLIAAADRGDPTAAQALFTSLYHELHRVAARQLRATGAGAMLSATTILHECYLGMAGQAAAFPDQFRFIAYAARAMRGLIIDHIRQGRALKRGGAFHLTSLDTEVADAVAAREDTVKLGDALDQLAELDPSLAELVDLKFFCGLTFADIAALRRVSERTVQRDWQKARLLLHHALLE